MRVDLINVGHEAVLSWGMGQIHKIAYSPGAMSDLVTSSKVTCGASALLFWDAQFGQPNEQTIQSLLAQKVDVWHAGLCLGMSGLPWILNYTASTWMYNCDPPLDFDATSWRLSLKASLIRTTVIRECRFINSKFQSLDAAALELGYQYIRAGVIMRHTPTLLTHNVECKPPAISFEDELLFMCLTQSKNGQYWSLARVIMAGVVGPVRAWCAMRRIREVQSEPREPYSPNQIKLDSVQLPGVDYRVTVLIPTLDRYAYLRSLLAQLRSQTIPPYEIIIVDQTDKTLRDVFIRADFDDLPLQVIYQDIPGQCSSRNVGLARATGDYILFLDDDDEVQPDLIERHLQNLHHFQSRVSSGWINEHGAMPAQGTFLRTGLSDVFPTNNTLIHKNVLQQSGLFDMAYERGQSEDGDLGMRIYLAGETMIYNPQIAVVHHRAPKGGLRAHKARVITYASSRKRLFHRRLPHKTEYYLKYRYFTPAQVRESTWLSAVGTFSVRGGFARKLLKGLIALLFLPVTIYQLHSRMKLAKKMLDSYPQIPNQSLH